MNKEFINLQLFNLSQNLLEVKSQQLLPEYQEQNLINQEQEDNLWQGF
jgi:hypothetical protein